MWSASLDFECKICLSKRRRVFILSFVQWIWCDQFNFLSKCTPRYFVVLEVGIVILFNAIGGQIPCLSVKVICHDLVSLILTFQFLYQDSSSWRCNWRFSEAVKGFSWTERMALSSAYSATTVFGEVGWSAMKMLKSRGAAIAPCGTPAFIVDKDDKLVR